MKYTSNANDTQGRVYSKSVEYDFDTPYRENGLLSLVIKILLIAMLVAAGLAISTLTVHAQACDTCDAGGWYGTVHAQVTERQPKSNNPTIHIVPSNDDVPPVTIILVPLQDNPTIDTEKVHVNNGNHYGNDKPDNNKHDCNNKHDVACNQ